MSSKDLNNNRYQQAQGGVNKIKFLLWNALMSRFNPEAKGRKRWDFLLLLLWCYCAFEMPFRFAFHLELDEDFLDTLKAIDAAADVIFLMDIDDGLSPHRCDNLTSPPAAAFPVSQQPQPLPLVPRRFVMRARSSAESCTFAVVHARTTFLNDGLAVTDLRAIGRRYGTSWFPLDAMCAMPFSLCSIISPSLTDHQVHLGAGHKEEGIRHNC
eukprot:3880307-Prymnesium_polylepis.2